MNSPDEEMERMLLHYFVNDEKAARGFQSLEAVFEQVHRPSGWRNSFFDTLEGPGEMGALSAILERMASDGLLERRFDDSGRQNFYRASDMALDHPRFEYLFPRVLKPEEMIIPYLKAVMQHSNESGKPESHTFSRKELIGLYQDKFGRDSSVSQVLDLLFFNKLMDAESKINGTFEGYYITDLGVELMRNPERFSVREGKVTRVERGAIDATSWTGKRLVLTDEVVLRDLRAKAAELRDRVYSTRFESNADSQDLKSLSDALLSTCEMAQPDIGIIEKILAHPKFKIYAGIIAAVATVRGAIGL